MSDDLPKGNNSKCRRGARAKKKNTETTVNDVSKILASMLNLSIEQQTRPPRRPKVQKHHNDFMCKNSEIHQMVAESNVLKISPNTNNKLKKKEKIRAVKTQKIVSLQTQEFNINKTLEIVSVQNKDNIPVEISETVSVQIPDIVSQKKLSVQIHQNEISPEEVSKILFLSYCPFIDHSQMFYQHFHTLTAQGNFFKKEKKEKQEEKKESNDYKCRVRSIK